MDGGKVKGHARGEIEVENGVLIIKRIHLDLKFAAPQSEREKVERVHQVYAEKCPIYMSLRAAIQITTSFELTG